MDKLSTQTVHALSKVQRHIENPRPITLDSFKVSCSSSANGTFWIIMCLISRDSNYFPVPAEWHMCDGDARSSVQTHPEAMLNLTDWTGLPSICPHIYPGCKLLISRCLWSDPKDPTTPPVSLWALVLNQQVSLLSSLGMQYYTRGEFYFVCKV